MTRERVVIDTNVLISGLLSTTSIPAQAVDRAVTTAQLIAATATLRELMTKLLSPKFKLSRSAHLPDYKAPPASAIRAEHNHRGVVCTHVNGAVLPIANAFAPLPTLKVSPVRRSRSHSTLVEGWEEIKRKQEMPRVALCHLVINISRAASGVPPCASPYHRVSREHPRRRRNR
jgi:hypothetical protein